MAKVDLIRGWHWDRKTSRCFFAVWNGNTTELYSRSFDGKKFGDAASKKKLATNFDNWRGWSQHGTESSFVTAELK